MHSLKTIILILLSVAIILFSKYLKVLGKNTYHWDSKDKGLVAIKSSKGITISYKNTKAKFIEADLNGNGIVENYTLEKGMLTITENSNLIWKPPKNWIIADFFLADITNDGITDINISLWKPGNYGTLKPFWVDKVDTTIKNHFFIYNLKDKMVPVWHSSNLDNKNQEILIVDIDQDNNNELITIETSYTNHLNCKNNYLSVWKWNGWGFYNVWKSALGNYCNLERKNNLQQIVVNTI
jgi:hypothetical protein